MKIIKSWKGIKRICENDKFLEFSTPRVTCNAVRISFLSAFHYQHLLLWVCLRRASDITVSVIGRRRETKKWDVIFYLGKWYPESTQQILGNKFHSNMKGTLNSTRNAHNHWEDFQFLLSIMANPQKANNSQWNFNN